MPFNQRRSRRAAKDSSSSPPGVSPAGSPVSSFSPEESAHTTDAPLTDGLSHGAIGEW